MKVSFENPDKINGLMTLVVEEADYKNEVEKTLKDYRKKANVPGFRPGQAPMGMIKRQFGASVKMEAINKLVGQEIYKYVQDNNIQMLGEPLPSEKQEPADLEKDTTFTFMFDIAVAPEFKVTLNGRDKVDYYNIKVDDKILDQQVEMYAQRAGSYEKGEKYEENDLLKGDIRELNDLKSDNIMAGQVLVVDAKKAVKKKKDTPAAPAVHTVKSGENLSAIADKYGVSVANLREWNDLKSDNIRVGDKLKLKADGKTSTSSRSRDNEAAEQTHKVKKGETLGQIATKYGVTVDDLRKWNNIKGNNIAAGQNLKVYSDKKVDRKTDKTDKKSKKKQKPHKVKRGETLGEIAEKYGVGLSKLKKANGIKGNNIQIGQSLKIPQ